MGIRFQVNNGKLTQFWLDDWAGEGPLWARYPKLFSIAANPKARVEKMRVEDRWYPSFCWS